MRNPIPVRLRPEEVDWRFGGKKGQRSSKWRRIANEALRIAGYRCSACGRHKSEIKMTVDHIIPVARGGTDTLLNARVLCVECHPWLEQAE